VFKSKPSEKSAKRLIEEQIYAQVVDELSQGQKRSGLWGKALADSNGEEAKAKSLYIKYRVQSIVDEKVILKDVERKEEERKLDKQRAVERERKIQLDTQQRQKWINKLKNFLLFIGVLFLPYIFVWFTLKSGYKTSTRILSFSYLALSIGLMFMPG